MRLGFAPDSAYDPETITEKITRGLPAQRLTKWAEAEGKGEAFRSAVWRAVYEDRKDIGDLRVLSGLAESAGLPEDQAESILDDGGFKDAVDADWLRSLDIDPRCVPSVLLNRELLENPQAYPLLERLMARHGIKRR